MKPWLEFTKIHPNNTQTMKKRFSGLMNLNSLFMSEGNHAPLITCIIPSLRWSMVAAASCSGGVFQWQGLGKWSEKTESWMQLNTEIALMKTWFRALRTSDWAESSPSNMTITLRTQPRQCRRGLGTTLWMSSSGPARAETWRQSYIFGETYNWLSTDGRSQPDRASNDLKRRLSKKNKCRCVKLVASFPKLVQCHFFSVSFLINLQSCDKSSFCFVIMVSGV